MHRSTDIEVKVGIFVALGLGLVMLTILLLGGGRSIFQRDLSFHTKFTTSEGLVPGANVRLAGVRVGQISDIKILPDSNQVEISFTVASEYANSIREDSTVGVQTQGMLGDRFLVVTMGTPASPEVKSGGELKSEKARELKDYLSNADEVLDRLKNSLAHMEGILGNFKNENRSEIFFKNLTSFSTNMNDGTKNARQSMEHLRSVMAKIDNGHGTLGALVNDPSLYDDLKALLGGANRNKVLKYFIRKSVEESRDAAAKDAPKGRKAP